MFNPFFNPYRVRRIDQGGIPTLDTIFSNVDTTNNTVTYGICPFQWRQLPCRGLILLNINHTATGATVGLTVATNKEEIANMVRQNYNEFKAKKEAASKYDEEMEKCKDILNQLEAQVEAPIITNTIDNSKEINDLKNDVADIRKMIEDTKKMFMGGFPKPPMPPMPNVPAPMK